MKLAAVIYPAATILAFAGVPALAKDPLLSPPLDCGSDGDACIIQQYTDNDASAAATDFTCGPLTYDGHKGTDFRLPTLAEMEAGVSVLSAAPGTVTATRDGMPDINTTAPDAPDVSNRECGNGLVINHGGGWETQYCHMKQGSIAVTKGDKVAKGAVLGQVGLSGRTAFPHIHLSVRKDGEVVDPFNPDQTGTCGAAQRTLWQTVPEYQLGGFLDIGFATEIPEYQSIKEGMPDPESIDDNAAALVVWGYAFAGQKGDSMVLSITGPDGFSFRHSLTLDRTQAELFRAAGKRQPAGGWPQGEYTGEIELKRAGAVVDTATVTTRIGG